LARRRLRIARPARVDIRARNPCRRFRRRTFGWKVRFTRREEMWTAGLRRPRASIEKRWARAAPEVIVANALCKKFERDEIHRLKTA
jgi:hypothetical protein